MELASRALLTIASHSTGWFKKISFPLGSFTHTNSDVVFSTKAMSLGGFFQKNRLGLQSRNLDSGVVFRQLWPS